MNVTEARAFLESRRGDQYGEIGVALNVLLPYAATRFERIEGVNRQLRADGLRHRRIVAALRASTAALLDRTDLDDPEALIKFLKALSRLLAAGQAEPVGLGQAPTPHRRAS